MTGSHLPSVYASNLAAALTVASRHLQAKAKRRVAPARLRGPDCAAQDG